MPRLSPEARGAAAFRAGFTPAKSPKHLSKEERGLWESITRSFPPDRFEPGSLCLLERYVRTVCYAMRLHDEVAKAEVGTPEHGKLHRLLMSANNSCGSLAALLRLSVQARVDRRSGQIEERQIYPRPWDDNNRLIGGNALRPRQWEKLP